jgi:hypothetical protein
MIVTGQGRRPKKPAKLANFNCVQHGHRLAIFPPAQKAWQSGFLDPKVQILFAFFFGAREDQPVLLRSRATLPAQPDFFGDSPRPPWTAKGLGGRINEKFLMPGRGFQGAAAPCMANPTFFQT